MQLKLGRSTCHRYCFLNGIPDWVATAGARAGAGKESVEGDEFADYLFNGPQRLGSGKTRAAR